ncbi:hypothetical protein MRX96_025780 [Rhipicephalus microplus]
MDRRWDVAGAASLTALFTTVMMMNSGVMSVVSHSSGLLVSCLQRHLSVFQLGLVGSVFLWAGILAAVFAPNMAWMTVTLGVIHGLGVGVVCVTLIIVVMMYFDKYRGVASGIKFAGYSMASLLFPTILTSLRDAYGLRGCMLVYAALTMNVTALTLLLKEPPWQTNSRNHEARTSAQQRKSVSWIKPAPPESAFANPVTHPDGATIVVAGTAELMNFATPNGVCVNQNMCNQVNKTRSACDAFVHPVVVADYFGIESVATGWGFAGVTLLPLLLCNPYIIGYFRDVGGSYDGLYQLQAGIHCFVGGLFGLLSVLDRRRQKKVDDNSDRLSGWH